MKAILVDWFRRMTSTKFMAAAGGYIIVMLDGLGWATFPDEVLFIAASSTVAYIGANVVEKATSRQPPPDTG